jgi:hypothetical protein
MTNTEYPIMKDRGEDTGAAFVILSLDIGHSMLAIGTSSFPHFP